METWDNFVLQSEAKACYCCFVMQSFSYFLAVAAAQISLFIGVLAVYIAGIIFGANDDNQVWLFPLVPAASIVALMFCLPRWRTLGVTLPMIALFVGASCRVFQDAHELRQNAKWMLEASQIQNTLRRQPTPHDGQLKHVEFDGFGGGFTMDYDEQIVEDPSDRLARYIGNRQMQRIDGIPCEASAIERQMAAHLYYVVTAGYDWKSCS